MYSYKKRLGSTANDICLVIVTILVIVSLFFFVLVISHDTLGSEELERRIPVANNVVKWTESIAEVGKNDIVKFKDYVAGKVENTPIKPTLLETTSTISSTIHTDQKYKVGKPILRKETTSIPNIPELPADLTVYKEPLPYHKLECPHGDLLTFWKPTTEADRSYVTPYATAGPEVKYVTFEPDVGGWNNIRMQMELVLVFAYATGRTLVLPPDQPMYLLNLGKGHQKAHSFADFFPFDYINTRMNVISMEEYMKREGITGMLRNKTTGQVAYPPGNKTIFDGTEKLERLSMWEYLRSTSVCPKWKGLSEFLVIPYGPNVNTSNLPTIEKIKYQQKLKEFSAGRKPKYYDIYWQKQKNIHFISKPGLGYRLLEHFYTFIYFENVAMDRYYKRFIRDYVHYIDIIFCKASYIIHRLLLEGNGSYSSFHVRRGEFQYKEVKIPASNMLANVGQFIPKNQLLFIATDEKNKSFFDPFYQKFTKIKYLDDYMKDADLKHINPNFLGMIDQVVCTRGEVFVGTWFSTFSGYITRMRGYLGYEDTSVYFGDKAHRDRYHKHELPKFPFYMREWNVSWYNIDES